MIPAPRRTVVAPSGLGRPGQEGGHARAAGAAGPADGAEPLGTTVTIPTLRTERLVLRAPRPGDFEPFAAFYASERASMVGGPLDRAEAWRTLAGLVGHWHLRGFGRWAVMEDDAPVGIVGLHFPLGWPEPEVGWIVFDGAEGRGLAYEAALAARAHAYDTLGWRTAVSIVHPRNARSIALAERMGARRDGEFHHPRVGPVPVWRHPGPTP